jgi:Tol biopolymer transport system component
MLAFTRFTSVGATDLYVVHLSPTFVPDRAAVRLTLDNHRNHRPQAPAWTADGRDLIFSSSLTGANRLWRIAAKAAQTPQRLEAVGEDGIQPTISRQGHRLVYTRSWSDANIWQVDLTDSKDPRSTRPGLKSSLLVASSRGEQSAQFSPDGTKIVFSSDQSGFREIWSSDSRGQAQVQLTNIGANCGSPGWSPDGAQIAFDSNVSGHYEIYTMSADGGKPRRMTTGTIDSTSPKWSADGKWIYFRNARSGQDQCWKMSVTGGEAIQVTRKGAFLTAESPDGAFLYYTKTDAVSALWKAPVSGGEETRVLDAVKARAFAVTEDGIYFFAPAPAGATVLQFHKFSTGQNTTFGTIEKPVGLHVSVSRDRRWLLYTQVDQQLADLMLVENFR